MLARLTRKWRWRAASLLVVAYALCLAAPTAVLALSGTLAAAHCLTDDRHGMAPAGHVHEHGSPHHHDGKGDDDPPGKCCGLFCLSALSPDTGFIVSPPVHWAAVIVARPEAMSGRGTDRIDRPPRSLPSL
jgi:hypothetical protein